jgi:hypothetical protein
MTHVTRNIDPAVARDLLERVPRACINFASAEGPQAQPVLVNYQNDRCLVGVPQTERFSPEVGQEVVLLVDEGVYYFDLRAIYIRGTIQPTAALPGLAAGHTWFEVVPVKTVAWDYGTMHEAADEPG